MQFGLYSPLWRPPTSAPGLSPQKRVHAGMANQHLSPSVTHGNTALHLCSYVLNELSINPTKRVEDDDVGRKIVFWSVTQIREVGEAVICILRPWPADRLIPGETEGGGAHIRLRPLGPRQSAIKSWVSVHSGFIQHLRWKPQCSERSSVCSYPKKMHFGWSFQWAKCASYVKGKMQTHGPYGQYLK